MRIFRLVLGVVGVLAIAGCTFKEPQAPTFYTDIYVPVGTQRTTGSQLVHDNEYIDGDTLSSNPLEFVLRGNVDPFTVGERLDVDVPQGSVQVELGPVGLSSLDARAVGFTLGDLWGNNDPPLPPDPSSGILPPFTFAGVNATTDPQTSFEWIHLHSGQMTITLTNRLSVTLGRASGLDHTLDIALVDPVDSHQIGQDVVVDDSIPPQGSVQLPIELSGAFIHNQIRAVITGGSPGSYGNSVLVDAQNQGLDLSFSFSAMTADSARATIPRQSAQAPGQQNLSDDVRLGGGSILDGSFNLSLTNTLPIGGTISVRFPEILRSDQSPYTDSTDIVAATGNGASQANLHLNFAGTTVAPSDGNLLQALHYDVTMRSDGSRGSPVTVGAHQSIEAVVPEGTIRFNSIIGQIDSRVVTLQETETDFNPPDGIDELTFDKASLTLKFRNQIHLASHAELTVVGRDAQNALTATIHIPFDVHAGDPNAPVTDSVTVDQSNSQILDLIRLKTRKLVTSGSVTIGADGGLGSANRADSISGSYTVRAPLDMTIGTVVHRSDPFSFTIPSEDQTRIREDVSSGEATGTVVNGFPAGLQAVLQFAPDSMSFGTDQGVALDPIVVAPAIVDSTGAVTEAVSTVLHLTIRQSDINFFARDTIYGQIVLTVTGPGGNNRARITPQDFVDVKAMLHFTMKVAK